MYKIEEFLSSLNMTLLGGGFLLASLISIISGSNFGFEPAWICLIICGIPIFWEALENLFCDRTITSPMLVSVAMIAAICIGEIFAAAEVAFIMAVGEILEDKTVERAKRGIKKLMSFQPVTARIINGKSEKIVEISKVKVGDTLRVLSGESIPVDGKILSGKTSINQSVLTGESLPVDKEQGDSVFCGTINCFGSIDIIAQNVGKSSSLEKLIRLVKQAESEKAPAQRIADKMARWLIPSAIIVAVMTYLITGDISRAVTILVVFCPCALVLATPTAIMAAIGQAAKFGVIVKSGAALENMGKVNVVAFDKTGTLTRGKPEVSDIISLNRDFSKNDILRIIASLESYSEHPLGRAILDFSKKSNIDLFEVSNFKMVPGRGIEGIIKNRAVICGNTAHIKENSINISSQAAEKIDKFGEEGKAVIILALNNSCIGAIALSDFEKSSAYDTVVRLEEMGVRTVILSGDNRRAASYLAKKIGISDVRGELTPIGKLDEVNKIKSENNIVCMVGDGVNDAPVLKTSDVGIAMGRLGSDIAADSADILLMGDDISQLPYLKKLANATICVIKFNISLSLIINFIAIALAALAILNPVTGALVHNAGAILVVLNAGLLYDRNFHKEYRAITLEKRALFR